jgi:hypothetical protein
VSGRHVDLTIQGLDTLSKSFDHNPRAQEDIRNLISTLAQSGDKGGNAIVLTPNSVDAMGEEQVHGWQIRNKVALKGCRASSGAQTC